MSIRNFYTKTCFKFFPAYRLRRSGAKVGKNVFFGEGVYIELENAKCLEIGDKVVLSAFTKIILHDSSLNNVDNFEVLFGKVIIKKNAYIGAGSIILPGATIGENTIVGAGSLVKGELKSDSVYAGNPVRYIETLDKLKSKWKNIIGKSVFLKNMQKWYEKKNP